jgi:hypothetical protein
VSCICATESKKCGSAIFRADWTDVITEETNHASFSPEKRELDKKVAALVDLETELAERELELLTVQGELAAFEGRYLARVGVWYAELDDLAAQIADAKARQDRHNLDRRQAAADARAKAAQSAKGLDEAQLQPHPNRPFAPGEQLKKLYRTIAKLMHPDLAEDDVSRVRRTLLMARANGA